MTDSRNIVFRLRSWRVVKGGGFDRAGKPRGHRIEHLKGGKWELAYFRVDGEEAVQIVKDIVFLGRKP